LNFDATEFRRALGRFASGVTVVTGTSPDGKLAGVTISAFSSLSLDPPLVLFCLGRDAQCREAFAVGRDFAVHVLAEGQTEISNTFASRAEDRFADVDYRTSDSGCPILQGCLAVLECRCETVHDGGDHLLVIGAVQRIERPDVELRPLLHFRGEYSRLA